MAYVYARNLRRIDSTYSKALFGIDDDLAGSDTPIIIISSTCYTNVSNLCNIYNKNFSEWLKAEDSKRVLNIVSKKTLIPVEELMVKVSGRTLKRTINVNGIYVHPDLFIRIAAWCSHDLKINIDCMKKKYQAESNANIETAAVYLFNLSKF